VAPILTMSPLTELHWEHLLHPLAPLSLSRPTSTDPCHPQKSSPSSLAPLSLSRNPASTGRRPSLAVLAVLAVIVPLVVHYSIISFKIDSLAMQRRNRLVSWDPLVRRAPPDFDGDVRSGPP